MPPIKLPAPTKKPKPQVHPPANVALDNMFKKYGPAWRPYENQILKWAKNYSVDPVYLGAIFLQENASARADAKSSTGALGPGQIQDTTVDPGLNPSAVWDGPTHLTDAWKQNFANAIKYTAWRVAGAVAHYGSLDSAYSGHDGKLRGYNPGFTGQGPSRFLPAGYIPSGGGGTTPTPVEKAGVQVAGQVARADLTDPWVVLKKGKITTQTGKQPKDVLTYGKTPMRLSDYNRAWTQGYADTFFAYTGRKARPGEIVQILKAPPTPFTLASRLAKQSSFSHSPVFKAKAPGFIADARAIMGQGWKPPHGFIANAIAQNWDQATFEAHVRNEPSYLKSPEFTNNYDAMRTHFESIYGKADAQTLNFIKDRTVQGWTPDQMESWLRAQPAYKQSPEYQAKFMSFASSLGLITGSVPSLHAVAPTSKTLQPTSPGRVPGPEHIKGDGLAVSY